MIDLRCMQLLLQDDDPTGRAVDASVKDGRPQTLVVVRLAIAVPANALGKLSTVISMLPSFTAWTKLARRPVSMYSPVVSTFDLSVNVSVANRRSCLRLAAVRWRRGVPHCRHDGNLARARCRTSH